MKIAYIICWCITNLAFIAMSVFLSIWSGNMNYLWFLTVPILSFLDFEIIETKCKKKADKNETVPFNTEED